MKFIASRNRLDKCLAKHVSNLAEPWGRILGQQVKAIRAHKTNKERELEGWPNAMRELLMRNLADQMAMSHRHPLFATYQQRSLNPANEAQIETRKVIYFITPAGIALLCSPHVKKFSLITAYLPGSRVSWEGTARRFLDRYCLSKKKSYRIPEEPKSRRQNLDGFKRDVEVSEIELHTPTNFGIHETRGTLSHRWHPPAWADAESRYPQQALLATNFAPRPTFHASGQQLRGGLEK